MSKAVNLSEELFIGTIIKSKRFNLLSRYLKVKTAGGIKFNSTVALSRIDEKLVQMILQQYKIFNAEVRN